MEEEVDSKKCERYNSYNTSGQALFTAAYEGIPQNLLINIIAYICLIILFLLLRKNAWNYGKLVWITHADRTPIIGNKSTESIINVQQKPNILWRFFNFLPLFIKMSDENLAKHCGKDAVLYCQFQRNLISLVVVMMMASLTIILPLNLSGHLLSSDSSLFSTLTIGNVPGKSASLWGHFIVTVSILLVSFIISNRFLSQVDSKKEELSATLIIKHVPIEYCDELVLEEHFKEAFPDLQVVKIQVCHKYDEIIGLNIERLAAEESLEYCFNKKETMGKSVLVVPKACGRLCLLSSCTNKLCCKSEKCQPVNGIEFYSKEVMRLSEELTNKKMEAMSSAKLPLIFVTMANVEQALVVRREYVFQEWICVSKSEIPKSTRSKQLKTDQWNVQFAPVPKDIYWANIHLRGWRWYIPMVLLYLLGTLLVLTFTTPTLVLNLLDSVNLTRGLDFLHVSPFVSRLAPALILVLCSSLLPVLVSLSVRWTRYWTLTTENIALMNQIYALLVLCVLILPSLGLNSVNQLIGWLFPSNETRPDMLRWECIFLPDGGALFCNYLITAAYIGTAFEYLRLGELFLFSCRIMCSRSKAEKRSISKYVLWEFPYGLNYAWTLALFTVIAAYSVVVPIITVFGLNYLICKHLVDRYNMINVNLYTQIHKSVHNNAAYLMQTGLILMQGTVTVYVIIRRDAKSPLSICCLLVFVLGLILTVGRTVKRWLYSVSWIKYSALIVSNEKDGQLDNSIFSNLNPKFSEDTTIFVPPEMEEKIGRKSTEIISQLKTNTQTNIDQSSSSPTHSAKSNYGTVEDEGGVDNKVI